MKLKYVDAFLALLIVLGMKKTVFSVLKLSERGDLIINERHPKKMFPICIFEKTNKKPSNVVLKVNLKHFIAYTTR